LKFTTKSFEVLLAKIGYLLSCLLSSQRDFWSVRSKMFS